MHQLEREETRCMLEATSRDPLTQRPFTDMIKETHSRCQDYYLARVQCKDEGQIVYHFYDARQLCKYIYEMVISPSGRRIRTKSSRDPVHNDPIEEVNFFRLRYDSDTPLHAEYAGNQTSFLENNCFRSKILYRETDLDTLSVSFDFDVVQKAPALTKKRMFTVFMMVVFVLVLGTLVIVLAEKEFTRRPIKYALGTKTRVY